MSARLMIGAMSGTSADGVDVALVEIEGSGLSMRSALRRHLQRPYLLELRRRIFAIRSGGLVALAGLARLGREISEAYAEAVNELLAVTAVSPQEVQAIAAHGQTLFHAPPDTIQWIDPALLAFRTGCRVVSDFRRADCAAGGQGAPLVPFADYLLFGDAKQSRILLNLGGIANLTFLGAGWTIDRLIAFDTGPANCISDHLMRARNPQGPGFDAGGELAATGTPIQPVVERVLQADWFSESPPKSTDGPEMTRLFEQAINEAGAESAPLNDLLATACAVAAGAVREAIGRWTPGRVDELIISGGGTENRLLMRMLEGIAGRMTTSDAFGVPSSAKEAIAFALLGAATLDGVPSNVPSATGAREAVVLGSITPRPLRSGPATTASHQRPV